MWYVSLAFLYPSPCDVFPVQDTARLVFTVTFWFCDSLVIRKERFCCCLEPPGFFIFPPRTLHSVNVCCHGDYSGLNLQNEGQLPCSRCTTPTLMQSCFSFDRTSVFLFVCFLFLRCYPVNKCDAFHADYFTSSLTSVWGGFKTLHSVESDWLVPGLLFFFLFFLCMHISKKAHG